MRPNLKWRETLFNWEQLCPIESYETSLLLYTMQAKCQNAAMFFVQEVMIAEAVKDAKFGCQLSQCKGQCCIEGDRGGPLTHEEAKELESAVDAILTKLNPESREKVVQDGAVFYEEGDAYTPLVYEEGPCVYLKREANGIQSCVLEQSFQKGEISIRKPKSCHLFPLLHKKTDYYEMLTIQKRISCASSWGTGTHLLEFEEEALLRVFGSDFVDDLFSQLNLQRRL